jgi:hypothetical protein
LILVTTSLRPGKDARLLARGLSNSIFGLYVNRGSMPFDAVIRKAASLGCPTVAFVMPSQEAYEIRFASVDGGWSWLPEVFNAKGHSQAKVVRKIGEVSSKSRKLKNVFGLCDSPFGAERTISYQKKRISVLEGKKEVFWVEGSFSKR